MNALPNSRERYLLQAVIHIANACLKTRMARPAAVSRLQLLAIESVSRAFPTAGAEPLMGISAEHLQQLLAALKRGGVDEDMQLICTN